MKLCLVSSMIPRYLMGREEMIPIYTLSSWKRPPPPFSEELSKTQQCFKLDGSDCRVDSLLGFPDALSHDYGAYRKHGLRVTKLVGRKAADGIHRVTESPESASLEGLSRVIHSAQAAVRGGLVGFLAVALGSASSTLVGIFLHGCIL